MSGGIRIANAWIVESSVQRGSSDVWRFPASMRVSLENGWEIGFRTGDVSALWEGSQPELSLQTCFWYRVGDIRLPTCPRCWRIRGCRFSCSMNKVFSQFLQSELLWLGHVKPFFLNHATITLGAGCFFSKRFLKPFLVCCPANLDCQEDTSKILDTGKCARDEQDMQKCDYDVSKGLADILDLCDARPPHPRQGADVGTQYRSAIYWHDSSQWGTLTRPWNGLRRIGPIPSSEVKAFTAFYPAEDYHQAYYELNKEAPYCRAVIAPKMAKFQKEFGARFDLD